jgi:hypothetical protein
MPISESKRCGYFSRNDCTTVTKTKLDRMDEQVTAFLAGYLARAPLLLQEMLELWSAFRDLGLPGSDFVAELTNGKADSFAQRVWEMMLGRHLHLQGYAPVCPNGGPDFRFDLGGRTVWVEATAPLPVGLPPEWLDPNYTGVGNFPHEDMLLRWTTALDAKWKKYLQYRKKGIVGATDAYVIAINGCLLSAFPTSRGISQMPFGVETVFPVGPLAYRVDGATGKIRDGHISERFHIVNANNAHIPTTPFVDPRYSGVSALIGSAATRCYGKPLDLHVVHNPLADVPLALGALGGQDDEWFATPVDGTPGEFDLQRPPL